MNTNKLSLRLSAVLPLLLIGQALPAKSINVNVASAAEHPNNTAIQADETFGVAALGTVSGNWNNLKWHLENLKWSDGTESTVGLTANFFESALNYYGPGYINTPLNYGPAHYAGTSDDPGTGFTVYNLAANFPDGYYVIVYMSGFLGSNPASGLVTDGRTTYYYRPPADNQTALTPEALIQATVTTQPSAGNFQQAHYAVFGSKEAPFRFSSFTVRIDHIGGGGVGIGGMQVVSASDEVVVPDWAGYPMDPQGNVDTVDWLGWLNVASGDWVWSYSLSSYIYLPEGNVATGGAWTYFPNN
jgi:hypothetical protein